MNFFIEGEFSWELQAGYHVFSPDSIPVETVNTQFSSGLQAVVDVADAIKAGYYDIGM